MIFIMHFILKFLIANNGIKLNNIMNNTYKKKEVR